MWYDRSQFYMMNTNYALHSFKQQNGVRRGSYEHLINQYYGKNAIYKKTLPYVGNFKFLDLNEVTKDVEGSLHSLLYESGPDSENRAEELVESYNKLLQRFDSLDNEKFESRKTWLTSLTSLYGKELQEAGFTFGEDGTLMRARKESRTEEEQQAFNELFTGEDSYGKHLLDITVKIGRETLSSVSRWPKLYNPRGSYTYTVDTGTLYNDIF